MRAHFQQPVGAESVLARRAWVGVDGVVARELVVLKRGKEVHSRFEVDGAFCEAEEARVQHDVVLVRFRVVGTTMVPGL